jgi:hypothetical protein
MFRDVPKRIEEYQKFQYTHSSHGGYIITVRITEPDDEVRTAGEMVDWITDVNSAMGL